MNDELWRWDACDLARSIRARLVTSRDATESCLRRLEQVNPRINAVVDVLADEALAAADLADRAVARGEPLGLLHRVPVTIKINVDYAGRATTNGVLAFRDRIAGSDSPCVANWRKAGAVFVGRTNVPAFSARFFYRERFVRPHYKSVECKPDAWGIERRCCRRPRGRNRCAGPRQRSCRLHSLPGLCVRRHGSAANRRSRCHIRTNNSRGTFDCDATHECARTTRSLDPRSAAWVGCYGGEGSARPVVGDARKR